MNCKDFKVGDNVIMYRTRNDCIVEDKVVKVGRKYVTTDRGYRFKAYHAYEFALVNMYECGELMLLFKDRTMLEEHENKKKALSAIRNMIGRYQLELYKKVHIDKIVEILKEGANEIEKM